jgi:hypothetical protein
MQIATALAAAVGVLASSGEAHGGSQRPLVEAIELHPGATCIESAPLAEQVAAWLGSDTADADLWIKVEGSPDDPRVVWFDMGRGDQLLARRRFAPGPERCDQLHAALGLAIALAIRVSHNDEIVGPREAPKTPTPTPQKPRSLWGAGGSALAGLGVLPGASVGASLRLERELPPNFALRLAVIGLVTWDKTLESTAGAFDAEGAGVRLDACVVFDVSTGVRLRGCAGFLGGGLFAQGREFASARSAASGWAAAANAVEVVVRLTDRWTLDGEISLVVPLETIRVGVQSAKGDVVEARSLTSTGVTMGLGPVYHF